MTLAWASVPLPGITGAPAQAFAPRIDPTTQRYSYVAYQDLDSSPTTLATLAEIDVSTGTVTRHTSITGTDALCTIGLTPTADQIILASLEPGVSGNRMWQITKSTFAITKESPRFGAAFGFSLSDAPITVSKTGEWVALSYTYDGTFGQYIVIWHTTTNIIHEGYLSSIIALPNSLFSFCFDASDNLYMAVHVTGKLYKCTLAEAVPGTVTITLANTFTLPEGSADIRAMHFRPSTNELVLWMQTPHGGKTNIVINFWNTLTDLIGSTIYTLTPGTNHSDAGMWLWDKYGWTNAVFFGGSFLPVTGVDCFFYLINISDGSTQSFPISLWATDFGGNFPPNVSGVYSPTYLDIYTTNKLVEDANTSRIYYLSSSPPAPPPTPPPMPPPPPSGQPTTGAYYIERMDNRIWPNIETSWCLDCALAYPMPTPSASITASSATGGANIALYNLINGGSGYTAPTGQVLDINTGGSGASVSLSVSGGVIVSAVPVTIGSGYKHPTLQIFDATGNGAVIQPIVTNYVTLSASAAVFTSTSIGDVVRMGGGKLGIVFSGTASTTSTVIANVLSPISGIIPDDPNSTVIAVTAGNWTVTTPTTSVRGLDHLEGMTVSALADGGVVPNLTVTGGAITLPVAASQILVGLPFTAQLQTLYIEAPGGATIQTRRKNITQTVIRVENSRAPEVGTNQPDAATQPNFSTVPWAGMTQIEDRTPDVPAGQPTPLVSGDLAITNVFTTWSDKGQIAVQQTQCVPLTITALVPWVQVGDSVS